MPAATYNWVIEQGTTVLRTLTWRDVSNALVNLTGATAHCSLKPAKGGSTTLDLTEAGSAGSRLILGGANGTIKFDIDATHTSALPGGNLVYDLKVVLSNATVVRVIQGTITVDTQVTI